jgi:hypothetical protein
MSVTVAFLVPAAWVLNVNTRRYTQWQTRRVAIANIRQLAGVSMRNVMRNSRPQVDPIHTLVRCDAIIGFASRHHRDVANWYPTVKAALDGIVDAGFLDDDDTTHVDGPHMDEAVDPVLARGGVYLEFLFEEIA